LRAERALRAVAACFIGALIGVGGSSVWLSRSDGAKEIFRTWTPSLGSSSSISTTKYFPAPMPAVGATSSELVHKLEAMPGDLAVVRRSVEQLTERTNGPEHCRSAVCRTRHQKENVISSSAAQDETHTVARNKADNRRRLDTSRNYQWHGGLGRASWHLEGDARRHCAGSGKGRVDGALGRSINSRDQQWTHFHAVTCSSGSLHSTRVQSIALAMYRLLNLPNAARKPTTSRARSFDCQE
jgi:hypothetical protein